MTAQLAKAGTPAPKAIGIDEISIRQGYIIRHLGEALDQVRRAGYRRLSGKSRSYIKGQKYTLLSHRENLTTDGRRSLKTLLAANKRLNTAYLLKGVVRATVGLRTRSLGAPLLRELARELEVAAARTLREVCSDD